MYSRSGPRYLSSRLNLWNQLIKFLRDPFLVPDRVWLLLRDVQNSSWNSSLSWESWEELMGPNMMVRSDSVREVRTSRLVYGKINAITYVGYHINCRCKLLSVSSERETKCLHTCTHTVCCTVHRNVRSRCCIPIQNFTFPHFVSLHLVYSKFHHPLRIETAE